MRSARNSLSLALALSLALLAAPGLMPGLVPGQAQDQSDKDALADLAKQQVQPASVATGGLPADAYKIAAKKLFGRQKIPANIKQKPLHLLKLPSKPHHCPEFTRGVISTQS